MNLAIFHALLIGGSVPRLTFEQYLELERAADFRIQVSRRYSTYPDVAVVCEFQRYRMLDSIKDYILVDQGLVLVEHFSKEADNAWKLRDYQPLDDEVYIDTIGVAIPLQRIYPGVERPAE